MRRLHSRFSTSPFKLQHRYRPAQTSDSSSSATFLHTHDNDSKKKKQQTGRSTTVSTVKVTDSSQSARGGQGQDTSAAADFAERYNSEIAPPSKMKEYQQFATKHKEALLAESKQLSEKYDEDLQSAHRAEQTVSGLFDMLNEFIAVMRTQEDLVEDVHDASKAATSHVKETDEQLLLTLQRSKSYQMSTVGLVLGLAFFLLLLDAATP